MNNLRNNWAGKSILVISLFTVMLSSCKKDEKNPEYVGTWVNTQAVFSGDAIYQIKDIMTFTKDGYDDLGQILDETTNTYIDYFRLIGSLTVSETIMNVHITEVGISTIDGITGKPTGTIVTYKEGTTQFESIFSQTGQAKSFGFEYSISENTMTVYSDNNADGDYADDGEALVYTRQ